jgi:hypothetical protein
MSAFVQINEEWVMLVMYVYHAKGKGGVMHPICTSVI